MKYLHFLFVPLLVGSVAYAVPPSKELVEKILVATNVEKQWLGMQTQIEGLTKTAMEQSLQGQTLTPEVQQGVEAKRQKIFSDFKQQISWENIKELYIQVYSENFTKEEVDGLLVFFQTAAGQAFLQKMPLVMQKANGMTQQRMKPAMLKMQQDLKEVSDETKGVKKTEVPTFNVPSATPPKG